MKTPFSLSAAVMFAIVFAYTSPLQATTVYIDNFNQSHSGADAATLDSSTGTATQATVSQTLATGTLTDAIGLTRTLTSDISATYSFVGNEGVTTEVTGLDSQLRLSNRLLADNPNPPDHTGHKVTWTDIPGVDQQLMDNVGALSLSYIQFIVRVSAGSNRDASYTADQFFDITLFSGADTAGFRGVMTDEEFTSGNDIFVTLGLYGAPDVTFNPNAVDKIVFQTTLSFTQGADLGGGTPLENAVLIKQITAVPEVSPLMLTMTAFGCALLRRRR